MVQDQTDAERRSGERTPHGRMSWPRVIGAVLLAFVVVEALILGLGMLITRVLDDTGLHTAEADAEKAILDVRDPTLNSVTAVGQCMPRYNLLTSTKPAYSVASTRPIASTLRVR